MKTYLPLKIGVLISVLTLWWFAWNHWNAQQRQLPKNTNLPVAKWSGPDSKITQRIYRKISSESEWAKLWYQHKGNKAPYNLFYNQEGVPKVNFDKYMIVAVFDGARINNAGVDAFEMHENNVIKLRLTNRYFQTA